MSNLHVTVRDWHNTDTTLTTTTGVTWWGALQKYPFPEGFVDCMLQLQSACASSASIERVFSTFGHIHSKLRNKLGVQKAAKLVLCYRMLRGGSEPDYWQSNYATDNQKSNWMISDSTFCQFLPYLPAETMFLPAKSTLCQFLPFVWQKQVSAGKKPTLHRMINGCRWVDRYKSCGYRWQIQYLTLGSRKPYWEYSKAYNVG